MHKVGIIAIFVLLKIENKGEIVISDIVCNSMCLWQSQTCIRINSVGNCSEFFCIKRNANNANFGYFEKIENFFQ